MAAADCRHGEGNGGAGCERRRADKRNRKVLRSGSGPGEKDAIG